MVFRDFFKSSLNVYDSLLFLLIVSQFFGALGGFFSPMRLLVFCLFPILLVSISNMQFAKSYIYESFFLSFWLFYGVISSIWSIDKLAAFKEIEILVFNFFSFFIFLVLSLNSTNPTKSIVLGWLTLFLLTVPIAIIELYFDKHLSVSVADESELLNYGDVFVQRNFASVTYMNLNGYNTMLCYTMPFIFSAVYLAKNKLTQLLTWLFVILLGFLIVKNGSRATFINYLLSFIVIISISLNNKKNIIKFILAFLIILFPVLLLSSNDFTLIFARLSGQGLNDLERTLLIIDGLNALKESYFFGIGAGNFKAIMDIKYKAFLTSPHNLFLEVFVQYGILVFLLFLIFIYRIYKKHKALISIKSKVIIKIALLTLPFTSIIDSGYLDSLYIWLYFASLIVIINNNDIGQKVT
jgi:hypothetical protein